MPSLSVKDLTLVIARAHGQYTTALYEGWPQETQRPIAQHRRANLLEPSTALRQTTCYEQAGETLCDGLRYLKNLLISHGHPCVKAIDGRVEAVESTRFALAPTGIIGTHPIMGQLSKSAVV